MRSLSVLLLAMCTALPAQAAESIAVVVLPTKNVARAETALLQKAARNALSSATSFEVVEVEAAGDASCAEQAGCLVEIAKLTGVDHLLALVASGTGGGDVLLQGFHASPTASSDKERGRRIVDPFHAEEGIPQLVRTLLPKHGLRGFGGIDIRAPAGARVRVDGQTVTPTADGWIGVPAGTHEVDVALGHDRAILFRERVAAGEQRVLDVQAALKTSSPVQSVGGDGLRLASYGLFSAGAVAVAASLVFGGLARSSMNGLTTCTGDVRDCSFMQDARLRQERGGRFANVGNGFAVLGGALMVSGGALFTYDLYGGTSP